MCNPVERKTVQFLSSSCKELIDPDFLEYIEKKTNAFIRPLKKIAQFEISGTELAVTLALSQFEEKAGTAIVDGLSEPGPDSEVDNSGGVITISPASQVSSSRLTDNLQRALSEHSDGVCSADDYKTTRPSVQRVLLRCLQNDDDDDIDDDFLFDDGEQKVISPKNSLRIYTDDGEEEVDKDKATAHADKSAEFAEITKKLSEAAVSEPEPRQLTKEQEQLRSFGLCVGYEKSVVNKALAFVDENTRPSDFIDILSDIKSQSEAEPKENKCDNAEDDDKTNSDVEILETETIEYADSKGSSPTITTVKGAEAAKLEMGPRKEQNQSKHDEYFKKLMEDFSQENESCDVEELKRRNAERQKLLKEKFQQQQQPKADTQGQANKGKKQKNKKKNKHGNKGQAQIQNTSDKNCDSLKTDSLETRTYSNDEEQTCVLGVWNNDSKTDTGDNVGQSEFQLNPWKKNAKFKDGPKNARPQPFGHPNVPQHNSPQRNQGPASGVPGNVMFVSPYQANKRKPMQVVTPVNVGSPQQVQQAAVDSRDLRYIVIDGSNVAMTHGNGKCFSCKGIRICVDYFRNRGHTNITVFVPHWRTRRCYDNQIMDQNILTELKDEGFLEFTPSRKVRNKLIVAYDDRFVLELAEAEDAVIVSNDQYRDLMTEKATWKLMIEERLLMYTFVKDHFMLPNDPLGRDGPCLDDFLRCAPIALGHGPGQQQQPPYRHQQQPYHSPFQGYQGQGYPALGQGQDQSKGQWNNQKFKVPDPRLSSTEHDDTDSSQGFVYAKNPWQGHRGSKGQKTGRSEQETENIFKQLKTIFTDPHQEEILRKVLANHESERDVEKLSNYCISVMF